MSILLIFDYGGAPVQIDNNVWLLLLLNVTSILAISWVSYKFLKSSTLYFKESESRSTISQFVSNVSKIFINRHLIFRRMIKIDSDVDPLHHLFFTFVKFKEGFCAYYY